MMATKGHDTYIPPKTIWSKRGIALPPRSFCATVSLAPEMDLQSVNIGLLVWYGRGSPGDAGHNLDPGIQIVIVLIGRRVGLEKLVVGNDIPYFVFHRDVNCERADFVIPLSNQHTWTATSVCATEKPGILSFLSRPAAQYIQVGLITLEQAPDSAPRLLSLHRLDLSQRTGLHSSWTLAFLIFV